MKEFYDYRRNGISQSILAGFFACRQYAKLHLEGWDRTWGEDKTQFGNFFHEVKGILYSRGKLPTRQEIKLEVNRYKKKDETDDKQLVAIVRLVLLEYFRFYKRDFSRGKWFGMESEFTIDFLGIKGLMRGKRDGLRKIHGKIWLKETKTKGMINAWQIQSALPLDFQTNLYMWATWKERKQVPQGVIYDIIRNPQSKPKKGEPLKVFIKRLKQTIRLDPEHYFIRYESVIEEKDLVEFERELEKVVKEFMKWQDGKRPTYKNRFACINKYGLCKFIDHCTTGSFDNFHKRKRVHNELEGGK